MILLGLGLLGDMEVQILPELDDHLILDGHDQLSILSLVISVDFRIPGLGDQTGTVVCFVESLTEWCEPWSSTSNGIEIP